MENIIDEIVNKYYGCYLYAKRYIKNNCNFYFDYEEMLLWEYYLTCKRISNKYNISQTKFYKELNDFYNKEYSENKTDSD